MEFLDPFLSVTPTRSEADSVVNIMHDDAVVPVPLTTRHRHPAQVQLPPNLETIDVTPFPLSAAELDLFDENWLMPVPPQMKPMSRKRKRSSAAALESTESLKSVGRLLDEDNNEVEYSVPVPAKKRLFEVTFDMAGYKPQELQVQLSKNGYVTMEGKHEERDNHGGFVIRQFKKKFLLPRNVLDEHLECKFQSDGSRRSQLVISAPLSIELENEVRSIPIGVTCGEINNKVRNNRNISSGLNNSIINSDSFVSSTTTIMSSDVSSTMGNPTTTVTTSTTMSKNP